MLGMRGVEGTLVKGSVGRSGSGLGVASVCAPGVGGPSQALGSSRRWRHVPRVQHFVLLWRLQFGSVGIMKRSFGPVSLAEHGPREPVAARRLEHSE